MNLKLEKLVKECKELSRLKDLQKEKTDGLQEMARLARDGKKDTEEFKILSQKYQHNSVVDFSDIVQRICKTVKSL